MDILDGLSEIKIGISYMIDGSEIESPPSNIVDMEKVTVNYVTLPGWKCSISQCRRFDDLPEKAQNYVRKVESLLGKPSKYLDNLLNYIQEKLS